MSANSFSANNANNKKNPKDSAAKEVDFLQGMSDNDLGPKPNKMNLNSPKGGFSKSRFNDSLFNTNNSPASSGTTKPAGAGTTKFSADKPAAVDNSQAKPKPQLGNTSDKRQATRDKRQETSDKKLETSDKQKEEASDKGESFVLQQEIVKNNVVLDAWAKFRDFIKKKGILKPRQGIEVNLVKDEVVKYFDWQKYLVYLLATVVFALSLIIFFYWGISWWGNKVEYDRSSSILRDYSNINKQVKSLEGEIRDVVAFQQELDIVNGLLDKHVYWTNFFDFLEKNTLEDVYFLNFSGNTNGTYSLSGQTKSFDALDAQVKKFLQHEDVLSAKIDRGSVSGGSNVSFSLDFSLNPKIFIK